MKFSPTRIPDVILIEPDVFTDDRGFFMETFRAEPFATQGLPITFVQDNVSKSRQGVLRGLHYQIRHAQGKLIRVVSGEVYDVAVDLRRTSRSFGEWVGLTLSADNRAQLWIPAGFAHGFYTISEWAEVFYKATDVYAPDWERTLIWNDPELRIPWPVADGTLPIVSTKDSQGKLLREAEVYSE